MNLEFSTAHLPSPIIGLLEAQREFFGNRIKETQVEMRIPGLVSSAGRTCAGE